MPGTIGYIFQEGSDAKLGNLLPGSVVRFLFPSGKHMDVAVDTGPAGVPELKVTSDGKVWVMAGKPDEVRIECE